MSKFDYAPFYGDFSYVAVSKQRYTKEQAIEIAKVELAEVGNKALTLVLEQGFVRHRAGVDDEYNPCVGWWLEWEERFRSCPCWVFHVHWDNELFFNEHELIQVS